MSKGEQTVEQREPKILVYDIECTGILGYSYGVWETNIHKIIEQPILLSFSYAWYKEGEEQEVICVTLSDTPTYLDNPKNDRILAKKLWDLFNQADVTLGHNSKAFDDKMANMFFMKHGFEPPVPHQQLDTKVMAKQTGRFPSNSLNNLSDFFGIGQKTETTHADLWFDSINGGAPGILAMEKMRVYNNQDINLTIQLYEILRPWYKSPVNLARIANCEFACPTCLSTDYTLQGTRPTKTTRYQQYKCKNCRHWFNDKTAIKKKDGDIQPAFV